MPESEPEPRSGQPSPLQRLRYLEELSVQVLASHLPLLRLSLSVLISFLSQNRLRPICREVCVSILSQLIKCVPKLVKLLQLLQVSPRQQFLLTHQFENTFRACVCDDLKPPKPGC